jgi:tetratricopeptide (TPR) repeat protein
MSRARKALCSLAVAVLFLAAARPGRADDATELERGKNSYDAGRYAEGAERFRQMLAAESPGALADGAVIERARTYYAACLIALGRNGEAEAQIEKVIRQNPLYTPDPVVFPGQVVDRFTDVKARLKNEIEAVMRAADRAARAKAEKTRSEQADYLSMLQRLAGQETVVVRRSRFIASIPFGVGQFQNGQDGLGYLFLISEALLAGTGIGAVEIHNSLVSEIAQKRRYQIDQAVVDDFENKTRTARTVSYGAFFGFLAVAVGGVAHAHLTFVPEVRESRRRAVPPPPVVPAAEIGLSRFVVGLSGRF